MNLKKFKINIFFFILLLLVFANKFDFFLNTYIILKNNAHSRLIDNYGYCNPQAYGFIKDVYNKYNLHKYNIKTSNKNIPISIIMRLFGVDLLKLKKGKKNSYWQERESTLPNNMDEESIFFTPSLIYTFLSH